VPKWLKTYSAYDVTHKKTETQNQIFFSLWTRRLAESLEGLNSSLAQFTGELWNCKVAQK